MLTEKIRLAGAETSSPEDILASSLGVIFPDDITNQHGDPSTSVIYLSPLFGSITLSLADPQGEDNRRLFSHFLWNSSVQLAEFIEEGGSNDQEEGEGERKEGKEGRRNWDVQGKSVLELGAGTGLAGIIAVLKGAERCVVSDYPAEEVLRNIKVNIEQNLLSSKDPNPNSDPQRTRTGLGLGGQVSVQGHEWGVLNDEFSIENKGSFDRILVADCLWMPWQHDNLLRSIAHFLKEDGRAWVIAGFHTGREKMRGFYEEERLREVGLEIEALWERNADGGEREWVFDRGIEDVTARKRWLVCGVLRKRGSGSGSC